MTDKNIVITGTPYSKLPLGLLPYLTNTQIKRLYQYSRKQNKWFVSGFEVVNCFKYIGESVIEDYTNCVCGVEIKRLYFIENKESVITSCPVIGCECIKNWTRHLEGYTTCKYCGRKNANCKDCKLCTPKKDIIADVLPHLFYNWKNLISPALTFGKHKDKTIYKVIKEDPKYIVWLYEQMNKDDSFREKHWIYYQFIKKNKKDLQMRISSIY